MRSGPPRKGKDGRYHLRGKLTVVTGIQLDKLLSDLRIVLEGCGKRQVILIMPVPRFWIKCCDGHNTGSEQEAEEDKVRVLRELGKFRMAVLGQVMKLRVSRTVYVLNPMEVLGVSDSVPNPEAMMLDQVHLLSGYYGSLAEEIFRLVAYWKAGKRKTEREGEPRGKLARGDGGWGGRGSRGGRGGRMRGNRGGRRWNRW